MIYLIDHIVLTKKIDQFIQTKNIIQSITCNTDQVFVKAYYWSVLLTSNFDLLSKFRKFKNWWIQNFNATGIFLNA